MVMHIIVTECFQSLLLHPMQPRTSALTRSIYETRCNIEAYARRVSHRNTWKPRASWSETTTQQLLSSQSSIYSVCFRDKEYPTSRIFAKHGVRPARWKIRGGERFMKGWYALSNGKSGQWGGEFIMPITHYAVKIKTPAGPREWISSLLIDNQPLFLLRNDNSDFRRSSVFLGTDIRTLEQNRSRGSACSVVSKIYCARSDILSCTRNDLGIRRKFGTVSGNIRFVRR